jgi:broad specificity phosphatase PhoE
MWARIASFEGGDMEELRRMNEESMRSGTMDTPEGLRRVMILADSGANRRKFIAFFDSREAIEAAEPRFEAMGDEISEDIRGRRTSVEVLEVAFEQDM